MRYAGWVRSVRRLKNAHFLELVNGTSLKPLQAILPPAMANVTAGMSLDVAGDLVLHPRNPSEKELHITSINTFGTSAADFPMQNKKMPLEYIRSHAHLRPRTAHGHCLFHIRNHAYMSIHNFIQSHDYLHIHTPVLTTNICEGGSQLFKAISTETAEPDSFFPHSAFLTPSAQLQLEAAAHGLTNVYTFSPCFRAEKSNTSRHLAEFTMLELESAFQDDLSYFIDISEKLIKHTFASVLSKYADEVNFLFDNFHDPKPLFDFRNYVNSPFQRITYTEAIDMLLKEDKFAKQMLKWGDDLSSEHEQHIAKILQGPVYITNYPAAAKPFYMKAESMNGHETCRNFDLIFPSYGEIIGGSIREHDYDVLSRKIEDLQINKDKSLDWYLDLRKYGSAPHGGFGLGFDRLLQCITGFSNIRDVVFMPRANNLLQY